MGFEVFVEFLQAGELRGETALGRGVDDKDDFAVELGEGVLGAAL